MYSHYLDALAICRVHGNPSFFITFTCNVNWPEIKEYMQEFSHVTVADRPDVVDRIFERKIHDLVSFLRDSKPFGHVEAGIVYITSTDMSCKVDTFVSYITNALFLLFPCSLIYGGVPKKRAATLSFTAMDQRKRAYTSP